MSDAVSSVYQTQLDAQNVSPVASQAGGTLGKDEFMEMLVTQMQNQDPLEPMNNTEMTAQLAQFSALEQMENLNGQFEMFQQSSTSAFSMMNAGQTVEAELANGQTVTGVLDKVQWQDGESQFVIGGEAYSIGNIQSMRVVANPLVEDNLTPGPSLYPDVPTDA